jgi:hypothetical protein
MDFFDEISNVQMITVTGPDGKKRRVKKRLPGTPEEERRIQIAGQMVDNTIKNIIDLSQFDLESVVSFQPIIDIFSDINDERLADLEQVANLGNLRQDVQAFRDMQTARDDDMFMRQNRAMEENLGRKGLSNSYAGQEARAFAQRNENLYRQESDIRAQEYGENLANTRLQRNAQAYGLNETGRNARLAAANTEYQLRREQVEDIERKRQRAIQENMNMLNIGSGIIGNDLNKSLSSNVDQLANDTFRMQSTDSLNRYTADVNARNAAYDRQLAAYNARPPSFTDLAIRGLGNFGGAMLTASPNSMAGRIGKRIF